MTWSPEPEWLEACPTCGRGDDCKCEPPVVAASITDDWRCEACSRVVRDGERVHLWADEDSTVVTHLKCPEGAKA